MGTKNIYTRKMVPSTKEEIVSSCRGEKEGLAFTLLKMLVTGLPLNKISAMGKENRKKGQIWTNSPAIFIKFQKKIFLDVMSHLHAPPPKKPKYKATCLRGKGRVGREVKVNR